MRGGTAAAEEDVEADNGVWEKAIMSYVVGNTPPIGVVERSIDDEEVVLFKGTNSMLNRPVIIKPWASDFNFKEEVLRTIPLWVKLPNFPLNCWTATTLGKIGSGLDEREDQASRPLGVGVGGWVGHVYKEENLLVEKPKV
ncbi:hypothetical protein KY290_011763 [Solanum tuberosum]|uniref:DUF4283 domain-containing protein n=1 Tax=Solanum tuberosum TaxID=4113 RepID=A0ABQ7W1L6_SOLTU|nr:hypothetical protein KY289_012285 [Solanum tuberosum]KAH0774626.1 hypothetical protein KY290_011763 [Solanum tuberosum]